MQVDLTSDRGLELEGQNSSGPMMPSQSRIANVDLSLIPNSQISYRLQHDQCQ